MLEIGWFPRRKGDKGKGDGKDGNTMMTGKNDGKKSGAGAGKGKTDISKKEGFKYGKPWHFAKDCHRTSIGAVDAKHEVANCNHLQLYRCRCPPPRPRSSVRCTS